MLPVQILAAVFGLCVAVTLHVGLARLLPTEQFALYGLALSVQHFGMIFQDGGFRTLMLREETRRTPGFPLSPSELLRQAVGHAGAVTLAGLLLVLLVPGLREFAWLMVLALAGGFTKTATALVSSILFARSEFLAEARWQTIGRVAGLTAAFAGALMLAQSAWGVFAALLIAQTVFLAPRWHGVSLLPARLHFDRKVYLTALPFVTSGLLTALYFRTGAFFLYRHDPDLVALAHFSLGHRLLDAAIFVMAPAAQMLFVRLRSDAGVTRLVAHAGSWLAAYLVATVSAIMLARLLGEPVVVALAGPAYAGAGALLPWFGLVLALAMPNFLLMQAHLAENRDRVILRSSVLAAASGLIANALLVPRFGAMGATIALVVSEAVQLASLAVGPWHRTGGANALGR